jgi:phosphoglycolate phosphatase
MPDSAELISTGLVGFLSQFEVVVFDCDGVLLDSNNLKMTCMRAALGEFSSQLVEQFLDEFRETFGRSRREHFAALFRDYLGRTDDFDEFYRHYAGLYAKLLAERYGGVPLCRNAGSLVRSLHADGVRLYVVTGTRSAEAVRVLAEKGLLPCFRAVLGGEEPKAARLAAVLRQTSAPPGRAILVGDAKQDLAAARQAGVEFLFVERYAFFSRAQLLDGSSDGSRPVFCVRDLAAEQVT